EGQKFSPPSSDRSCRRRVRIRASRVLAPPERRDVLLHGLAQVAEREAQALHVVLEVQVELAKIARRRGELGQRVVEPFDRSLELRDRVGEASGHEVEALSAGKGGLRAARRGRGGRAGQERLEVGLDL